MALALDSCPVDEDAHVRLEPRAGQHDVGVQAHDLAHEPGVLELWDGLLLDTEDDGVGAADADRGVALAGGLEGVLDPECSPGRGREGGREQAVAEGEPGSRRLGAAEP